MTELIKALNSIYLIVRLVDVNTNTVYMMDSEGVLTEQSGACFDVWGKKRRCVNCVSAQAYSTKGQLEKFEFIGNEIYYVISKYIEVQGRPYMLELVNKVDNKSFIGSVDQHLFAEQIQQFDRKLYVDALTGAYNRLYYEEQLQKLDSISAIAMFDIDHFKGINDTYGHQCGDAALRSVAEAVLNNIRNTDALIRYGGDEFLIVFSRMPEEIFLSKLERIRSTVESIRLEGYPKAQITLSIGGILSNTCNEAVIKQLDDRMYEAKEQRNCVVIGEKN